MLRQANEALTLVAEEPNTIRNSLHIMMAHLHRYKTEMETLESLENLLYRAQPKSSSEGVELEPHFGLLRKFILELESKTQTTLALVSAVAL